MIIKEYSKEEKLAYLEKFKKSGMSQKGFAREENIPETTFRGWLKQDRLSTFGEININNVNNNSSNKLPVVKKIMVFVKDDIKIELKEGFDKKLLKNIVEVFLNVE